MYTVVWKFHAPHNTLTFQIDGDTKELFAIGTNRTEPCLLPLMSGEILVLKEEMQISLDSSAKPTQQQPLVWSDLPMAIEHVHPFIVGLLPKWVEGGRERGEGEREGEYG